MGFPRFLAVVVVTFVLLDTLWDVLVLRWLDLRVVSLVERLAVPAVQGVLLWWLLRRRPLRGKGTARGEAESQPQSAEQG